jgi:hypothetical protein
VGLKRILDHSLGLLGCSLNKGATSWTRIAVVWDQHRYQLIYWDFWAVDSHTKLIITAGVGINKNTRPFTGTAGCGIRPTTSSFTGTAGV